MSERGFGKPMIGKADLTAGRPKMSESDEVRDWSDEGRLDKIREHIEYGSRSEWSHQQYIEHLGYLLRHLDRLRSRPSSGDGEAVVVGQECHFVGDEHPNSRRAVGFGERGEIPMCADCLAEYANARKPIDPSDMQVRGPDRAAPPEREEAAKEFDNLAKSSEGQGRHDAADYYRDLADRLRSRPSSSRVELADGTGTAYVVEPCEDGHDCKWVAWPYDDPQTQGTGETPPEAIAALTGSRPSSGPRRKLGAILDKLGLDPTIATPDDLPRDLPDGVPEPLLSDLLELYETLAPRPSSGDGEAVDGDERVWLTEASMEPGDEEVRRREDGSGGYVYEGSGVYEPGRIVLTLETSTADPRKVTVAEILDAVKRWCMTAPPEGEEAGDGEAVLHDAVRHYLDQLDRFRGTDNTDDGFTDASQSVVEAEDNLRDLVGLPHGHTRRQPTRAAPPEGEEVGDE